MLLPAYYRWISPIGKHQTESAPKLRSFECRLAYESEMVSGLFQIFRLGARPLKSVQIFENSGNSKIRPTSSSAISEKGTKPSGSIFTYNLEPALASRQYLISIKVSPPRWPWLSKKCLRKKHNFCEENEPSLPALASSGSKSPRRVLRGVGLGIFYFKFPPVVTSFHF